LLAAGGFRLAAGHREEYQLDRGGRKRIRAAREQQGLFDPDEPDRQKRFKNVF